MPLVIRRYRSSFIIVTLSLLALWAYYPMTVGIMAQMVGQAPHSPSPMVKFCTVLSVACGIALSLLPTWMTTERSADRWFFTVAGIITGGFLPFLIILGIGLYPELFNG